MINLMLQAAQAGGQSSGLSKKVSKQLLFLSESQQDPILSQHKAKLTLPFLEICTKMIGGDMLMIL